MKLFALLSFLVATNLSASAAEVQTDTIYLAGSYVATAKELGLPINNSPIKVTYIGENAAFISFSLDGTIYKVPAAAVLLIQTKPQPKARF